MKNLSSFLVIGLLFIYSSCTKTDSTPTFDVSLGQTSLGQVLTGANGKTLYFFASDISGQSQCTGGCLTNCPFFTKKHPPWELT